MKTLLVLRHAKSSWDDASIDDSQRPLNARGRRDAPRVGELLREQHVRLDAIVTSDAVRARSTAQAVAEAANYAGELIIEPRLYLASPEDIVSVLQDLPEAGAETVMIVGHNPGLEDFVSRLTGERHSLPTAALVRLALSIDRWSDFAEATRATLVDLWCPR
jgi:phosphohistidine phosphatase